MLRYISKLPFHRFSKQTRSFSSLAPLFNQKGFDAPHENLSRDQTAKPSEQKLPPGSSKLVPDRIDIVRGSEREEMVHPEMWDHLLPRIINWRAGEGESIENPVILNAFKEHYAVLGCIGDCFEKQIDFDSATFTYATVPENEYYVCSICGMWFYAASGKVHALLEGMKEYCTEANTELLQLIERAKTEQSDEAFKEIVTRYDDIASSTFPTRKLYLHLVPPLKRLAILKTPKSERVFEEEVETEIVNSFTKRYGNDKATALKTFAEHEETIEKIRLALLVIKYAERTLLNASPTPLSPYKLEEELSLFEDIETEDVENKDFELLPSIMKGDVARFKKYLDATLKGMEGKEDMDLAEDAVNFVERFKKITGKSGMDSSKSAIKEAVNYLGDAFPKFVEAERKIQAKLKGV